MRLKWRRGDEAGEDSGREKVECEGVLGGEGKDNECLPFGTPLEMKAS